MMRAADQNADEAEPADVLYLPGSDNVTVSISPLGKDAALTLQPCRPLISCACAGTMRWIAPTVAPLPVTAIARPPSICFSAASALSVTSFMSIRCWRSASRSTFDANDGCQEGYTVRLSGSLPMCRDGASHDYQDSYDAGYQAVKAKRFPSSPEDSTANNPYKGDPPGESRP
jgi:hypothetical protein